MQIISEIIAGLPDGEVQQVCIGLHWTAVVVDASGERRCGLAATLYGGHNHDSLPDVDQAGRLELSSGLELAELALSSRPTQASVGMAAINALLSRHPAQWTEENAESVLARVGAGKRVAMVGHFPFVERLRPRVGELVVLEQNPLPGDLPAEAAINELPKAGVVAITGMTFTNHTLERLLALCQPEAYVMVMGPSTPLSPVLFNYGVNLIAGAVVTAIDPVLHSLSQGANFKLLHRAGVRLANLIR